MKLKAAFHIGILTVLLLAVSVPVSAVHCLPEGCSGQSSDDQVVVYYFTREFRCQSCEILENIMVSTVRDHYQSPFSSGKLAMCVINLDNPENWHFMDEFEIVSTSVYIVEKYKGKVIRIQSLEKIWEILDDTPAVSRLLTQSISEFLSEEKPDSKSRSSKDTGPDRRSEDPVDNSDDSRETSKPAHRTRDPEGKATGSGNQD